jgi:hypothetical protein
MKTYIGIIIVCIIFFAGCSDQTVSPLDSNHKNVAETGSLGKVYITNFTGVDSPVRLIDPGTEKLAGRKWIIKEVVIEARADSEEELVTGVLIIVANETLDFYTGEGPVYGKFTLTPDIDVDGGIWEGTWHGQRVRTDESEWKAYVKLVAHGKGGTIHGMKLFADETVTTWALRQTGYIGMVEGYILSH